MGAAAVGLDGESARSGVARLSPAQARNDPEAGKQGRPDQPPPGARQEDEPGEVSEHRCPRLKQARPKQATEQAQQKASPQKALHEPRPSCCQLSNYIKPFTFSNEIVSLDAISRFTKFYFIESRNETTKRHEIIDLSLYYQFCISYK